MKNITLSADERLIRVARERARAEHTTLTSSFAVGWPTTRDASNEPRKPWIDPGAARPSPHRRSQGRPGRDERAVSLQV